MMDVSAKKIIDEIRNKVEDYETNMSSFFSEFNDWNDLFTVKRPSRASNTFSNPRLTEMFKAVNALATMEYRMMTSQKPFLEVTSMDFGSQEEDTYLIQHTLETQLKVSKYCRYLLKSLYSKELFGTTIVEEPFEWVVVNPLGRRLPVTKFVPRSMLQICYDRNTTDIDLADWISTHDVVNNNKIERMAKSDVSDKLWIKSELNEVLSKKTTSTINQFIVTRLANSGYNITSDNITCPKEMISYRGKLDCLNDGIEYGLLMVNRENVVKFYADKDQSGKRPFRVARWVEWELESQGLGLGRLFGNLHRSMDANRRKLQDNITFNTYNMWLLNRMAGIRAEDFKIKPWHIIEADDLNALKPIETGGKSVEFSSKLEDILKADFRQASGATDTMQAIITEATASEVSLAQNEAMRNISVKTEQTAESLMREHFEMMHYNNISNIGEPFVISTSKGARIVYPKNLNMDIDISIKIVTDKDFRPNRTKHMLEAYQILTSIRNQHPDKYDMDLIPLETEIMKSLDVPYKHAVRNSVPQLNSTEQLRIKQDISAEGGTQAIVQTPVGQVMGSMPQAGV